MATSVDEKIWHPTEEQRRAIDSIGKSMAVDAAAGSGKTSVLIHRILRIVDGDWSRISRLLAITFTEKAAGELKARLRRHVPAGERHLLEGASIGTFHGFCARILRRHAPRIGIDPSFSIMEENAAKLERSAAARETLVELLNSGDEEAMLLVETVEFKAALGALENLMEFRLHAGRALENIEGAKAWEGATLRALASLFGKALERYRALLSRLSSLDFEELEICALELCSLPEIKRSLSQKFDHILVDEFQDTSDAQTELVLALFDPPRSKLFIVGDEAQSIYRFRGANVGCFARMRRVIEESGGESVQLSANFRSDHSIVRFINGSREALADGLFAKDATRELMQPKRSYANGEPPVFAPPVRVIPISCDGNAKARRELEARAVACHTAELCSKENVFPGDVVFLFRALTSVAPYEAALRREGIPAIVSGGRSLLDRREVVDLMAALSFAADDKNDIALLTLLRSPMINLSDDELALLSGDGRMQLSEAALDHPSCKVLKELRRLFSHLRPSEFLRRTLDLTGYEAIVDRIDPSGGMGANIDRFITVAESIESELAVPVGDFAAFVGNLRAGSARLGDPPAAGDTARAVRLMSVHAAKGLEFPVVFLPDLFHGGSSHREPWIFSRGGATNAKAGFAFKLRDPERPLDKPEGTERFKSMLAEEEEENELEMKRLLYVAMTRARDLLVLPIHEETGRAGPWHGWVAETIARAKDGGVAPTLKFIRPSLKSSPAMAGAAENVLYATPLNFSKHVRRSFTVTELETYDSCPLRFSHTFVTGLPSRNFRTAADDWIEKELFGIVVHAALAGGPENEPGELSSIIRAACVDNGVVPADDFIRRIERQVRSARELSRLSPENAGFRELSFEWPLKDAVVTGSIDWLKSADGGFEVVDFKTGEMDEEGLEKRALSYDLQLTTYALAAEEMTGRSVSSTKVIFTGPAVVVERKMTKRRADVARLRIERAIEGIRRCDFSTPIEPPCERCPYHHNRMCWENKLKKLRR